MDFERLAIVGVIFLFAAVVKGTTGLGFSTSALPLLALTVGVKAALPLLIIPSLASNAMVMRRAGHFIEMLRRFAWLYVLAPVGIAGGLALLNQVDGATAGAALGIVLVVYSLFVWRTRRLQLPIALERPLAPIIGAATGAINGLTGSQVMPLLPYLMALGLDPRRLVQATNISFTLSSLVMAFGLMQIGLMTAETAAISVLGLLPVYIGIALGTRIQARLSASAFHRAIVILLGLSGLILVLRPAMGF